MKNTNVDRCRLGRHWSLSSLETVTCYKWTFKSLNIPPNSHNHHSKHHSNIIKHNSFQWLHFTGRFGIITHRIFKRPNKENFLCSFYSLSQTDRLVVLELLLSLNTGNYISSQIIWIFQWWLTNTFWLLYLCYLLYLIQCWGTRNLLTWYIFSLNSSEGTLLQSKIVSYCV